ncbi:MAG: hypothetical protein EHM43_05040 [Ignavibacteriae bacterium]|nr:MAG: hypothetical protein EHM43_05040 [Ignavibacteriota bacterium]
MERDLRYWLQQALLFGEYEAIKQVLLQADRGQLHDVDPEITRQVRLVQLLSGNEEQTVIEMIERSSTDHYSAIDIISLARALHAAGRSDEAVVILNSLINEAQGYEPVERLAFIYRRSRLYTDLGRYTDALHDLTIAASHAEVLDLPQQSAEIMVDLSNIASASGDPIKAITYAEQSLLYLDRSSVYHSKVVRQRVHLAMMYVSAGRLDDALTEYTLLSTDGLVLSDSRFGLPTFLNLAITYKRLGQSESSLETYQRVLDLSRRWDNAEFEVRALIGITDHYVIVGDIEQAKHYIKLAMESVAKNKVDDLEDIVNIHYANVDHASGDLDAAITRLQIYYDRYNADRNVRDTVLYGLDLAEWLAEARRHDEAYSVLKNCSELQRSVYDQEIERTTQVSALRSKLDVERESVRQRDEARTAILNSVLPAHIAHRLMAGERKIGERVASASILFADIVGFTHMAASMEPEQLVDLLEDLFAKMDDISLSYGCERIKTIGDSYMAACGLAGDHADHTERLCRAALAIVDEASHLPLTPSQFRIGIHSGPVVAGVMSGSKLSYDIWGDTVNVASRMEKHSAPGRVLCSSDAAENIVHTPGFVLNEREPLDIRGKGLMTTFWLSTR